MLCRPRQALAAAAARPWRVVVVVVVMAIQLQLPCWRRPLASKDASDEAAAERRLPAAAASAITAAGRCIGSGGRALLLVGVAILATATNTAAAGRRLGNGCRALLLVSVAVISTSGGSCNACRVPRGSWPVLLVLPLLARPVRAGGRQRLLRRCLLLRKVPRRNVFRLETHKLIWIIGRLAKASFAARHLVAFGA